MRRKTFARLALLALAACARRESGTPAAQATPAEAKPYEVDTRTPLADPLPMLAAKVNGRGIPTSQVVAVAENALRDGVVKDKIAAYRQTLNQMVVRELLLEEAVRRGLAAADAAVERAYDEARVAYREDQDWAEALKKQGFTPAQFREELRAKQTVNLLLSQEAQKVPDPGEAELREVYDKDPKRLAPERLRVAHILIRLSPGMTPQQRVSARVRAEQAREAAASDFAAAAKQYSEDPATSAKGGVLEFAPGEVPKPFEAAASALRPGEISEVVETPYGHTVIKLLERLRSEPPPFDRAKEQLRMQLAQARRQEQLQLLVNRLRARARIETFL